MAKVIMTVEEIGGGKIKQTINVTDIERHVRAWLDNPKAVTFSIKKQGQH